MEEYIFEGKKIPNDIRSNSFIAIVKTENDAIKFKVSSSKNNVTLDCDEDTANQIKSTLGNLIEYTFIVDDIVEKSGTDTRHYRDNAKINFNNNILRTNIVIGNCHIKIKPIAKLTLVLILTKPFIPQTLSELIIGVLFVAFGFKYAIIDVTNEEKELIKYVYNYMKKTKKENFDPSIFVDCNNNYQEILTNLCNKRIFYNKNGVYEICYK